MREITAPDLHSIMYLLIPGGAEASVIWQTNLHSIMYLLILGCFCSNRECVWVFTFHNVSINSEIGNDTSSYNLNLHSIMYLLIPFEVRDDEEMRANLHSIMYLLIRVDKAA